MATAITKSEALEFSGLLLKPLLLLIVSLLCRDSLVFARVPKVAILLVIARFSTAALKQNTLYNTLPAYLLGAVTFWILIISTGLLLCHNSAQDFEKIHVHLCGDDGRPKYETEGFPRALRARLSWVLDLIANVRGIGWDHSSKNSFRNRAGELYDPGHLKFGTEPYRIRSQKLRSEFLQRCLWVALVDYMLLDICICLVRRDPFLSGAELINPFSLSSTLRNRWFILLPYRLLIAAVGVYSVLDLITKVNALVCVGVLGEKLLGSWGQYWNYPPLFGSIWAVWDRGLAGFWANFWHHLFRFGFVSVADGLVPVSPSSSHNQPGSSFSLSTLTRRLLHLSIVFTLSGLLHASGSWTLEKSIPTPLLTRTYPQLTMLAFVLQVPGIIIQELMFHYLSPDPAPGNEITVFAFKFCMLIFTCVWSLGSFPFVVADFAAGRLFQIPFLPFSFVDAIIRVWGMLLQ